MNKELYSKLVDLYAGDELPEELKIELETAASADPALSQEMNSLKKTVSTLKELAPAPNFTEESFQRVLMKMYARGVDVQTKAQPPAHIQYHLPMTG